MKKMLKRCALIFILVLGMFSFTKQEVLAQVVLKSYEFDQNYYTGTLSNFGNYYYTNVNDYAYFTHATDETVANYWNYKRVRRINYYYYNGIYY